MPDLGTVGNSGTAVGGKTGGGAVLGGIASKLGFGPQAQSAPINSAQQGADFAAEQKGFSDQIANSQGIADTAVKRYQSLAAANKGALDAYGANTTQGLYEGRRGAANALAAQQGAQGGQGGRGGYAALLATGVASGQQAADFTAKRGEGYQQLAQELSQNEYNQDISAKQAQGAATAEKQKIGSESQRRETKWGILQSKINDARTNRTGKIYDDVDLYREDLRKMAEQETDPVLKQRIIDISNAALKAGNVKPG